MLEGERWDLNPRMAEPQSAALTAWPRSPRIISLQYSILTWYVEQTSTAWRFIDETQILET